MNCRETRVRDQNCYVILYNKCAISQVEKLKSELDESLLNEKQLKHKLDHLKEVITSKSERVMPERVHETMSSEVLSLQLELIALENSKVC